MLRHSALRLIAALRRLATAWRLMRCRTPVRRFGRWIDSLRVPLHFRYEVIRIADDFCVGCGAAVLTIAFFWVRSVTAGKNADHVQALCPQTLRQLLGGWSTRRGLIETRNNHLADAMWG